MSTDTDQAISFEVNDLITENDEPVIDFDTPSAITDWIVFEPAAPILEPGESVSVTITFNIPAGTRDGALNANIRTFSTAATTSEFGDSDAGTQAVIGTRLAIDVPVWVGVGDAIALAPIFDITGVDGALIRDEKFVRIFFENTGITPVTPVGRMQLSDPNFVDRIFEPVDFRVPTLDGGELAYIDVPVDAELEDGAFRVFVTAQSGSVRITRLFDATLVFDDPNLLSIPDLALRIAGFVLAALGLVFGVRLIRADKGKVKTQKKPRVLRSKLRRSSEVPTPPEESLEALQAAIARMEQQFQELNKELAAATKVAPKRKAPVKAKTAATPKPPSATAIKPATTKKPAATKAAAKPAPKKVVTPKKAVAKAPASPVKAAAPGPRARTAAAKPTGKKTAD